MKGNPPLTTKISFSTLLHWYSSRVRIGMKESPVTLEWDIQSSPDELTLLFFSVLNNILPVLIKSIDPDLMKLGFETIIEENIRDLLKS